MGGSQSRVSDSVITEKLAERLRAMELEHQRDSVEEAGFVHVSSAEPYTADVSIATTEEWQKQLLADPKNRLAISAYSRNDYRSVIRSKAVETKDTHIFNTRIAHEATPVVDQGRSGRCWIFASTNVFRVAIIEAYKLKEFELSQSYLFFWDKLEKANYFLEQVLDTTDEPLDGRLMQTLLAAPVNDGGQWDMVSNLVQKYGLVPKSLYPDNYNAYNSSAMDELLTSKLREDALRLRKLASSSQPHVRASISGAKARMMREVHLILTLMLGPPPSPSEPFTWEYYDDQGRFNNLKIRPQDFAYILSDLKVVRTLGGTDVTKLFSLVNDPRNPYMTPLSVKRLGNVVGGRPVTYVNVDMATLKAGCVGMLKAGFPVFFGSDVGKFSARTGVMDTQLYDYELGFNVKLGMSKAERLMTGESAMTHAMVLTGVHIVDGKIVRWRVENSWSSDIGDKGYFVMTDAWMDEFVYQAVVDPSVVGKDVRDVLKKEPKLLELWDPMGALA